MTDNNFSETYATPTEPSAETISYNDVFDQQSYRRANTNTATKSETNSTTSDVYSEETASNGHSFARAVSFVDMIDALDLDQSCSLN